MSKNNNLLNNNSDEKEELIIEKTKDKNKKTDQTNSLASDAKNITPDEIINVELYNEILSTLFNSLNNPVIRNEIKVNEDILKYLELQISNLFFLETALTKKLKEQKMAKEFLQLVANITDLPLTINKSPKKTRIEILEDRNLLIVTIVNSCKGIERETLEKSRIVDLTALQSLNNQIAALSNFTTEETVKLKPENQQNSLNNTNIKNLTGNMENLTKLGVLPQHPATNPNFYPYLTKPLIVTKLKKILSGMLIVLNFFILTTIITTLFVKGQMLIDITKAKKDFVLTSTISWPMLVVMILVYGYFAYIFLKPTKILREKYHISYFILGLISFSLVATGFYFFWAITDANYNNIFLNFLKENKNNLNPNIIQELKDLPNFIVFEIFSIITGAICGLTLIFVIALILISPRLDRNKVIRANTEYQNAITAALNGQKYDIDPTLFEDNQIEPKKRKPRKTHFKSNF